MKSLHARPQKQGLSILVAGGAGYIGSRLVPELRRDGHHVVVVDLLWFGNHLDTDVPLIQKDILEVDPAFLSQFDQVIFLAGLSNDPMADYSPALNFIENAAAPAYLAYAAKKAGVKRYIYAESCSVYGASSETISRETTPGRSTTPYGVSKLCGGLAANILSSDAFSVIRFRKGTVSGHSARMRFDLLVNTMYMSAMTKGAITVNNPRIWRPLLAIEDAVAAYRLAVALPYDISGTFNIASGNFQIGTVAKHVAGYLKRHLKVDVPVLEKELAEARDYRVTCAKARKELGFMPHGTIESILKELHTHYPKGFDFNQEHLYNITTFKRLHGEGGLRAVRVLQPNNHA